MDILIRLRVLLWAMVLALWGLMVWQFLGNDDKSDASQMRWVSHQVTVDTKARPAAAADDDVPDIESQSPTISADKLFPPRPPDDLTPGHDAGVLAQTSSPPLARIPAAVSDAMPAIQPPPGYRGPAAEFAKRRRPAEEAPPPQSEEPPSREEAPPREEQVPPREEEAPPPTGFTRTTLKHFVIYAEGKPPSLEFQETVEQIHANLMLDLAAFAPWARDEKVTVYLFRDQDSYRRVTGRPAWSGGASSVKRRKVYLYESDEIVGIMAHEFTHIYFDGFFLAGATDPLWLSEGMATLVQTERGLAAPNWLRHNLDVIKRGGGYTFDQLMKVDNTTSASDDEVRLWYSESYSVVRFLIRSQYKSSFYRFCRFLRDGSPVKEALYRAYGMPFNSVKALEYAWRYDQQSGAARRL